MTDQLPMNTPEQNKILKRNFTANIAGSLWQSLVNILFVPFYISFIGIESYGLIGLFASIQLIFGLSDAGLGSTVTRELARLSTASGKENERRDLVRTLEIIYWCISLLVGGAIILISPVLTHQWVNSEMLSPVTVEEAFMLMGLITMFQMPIGFYSSGLMGLQKQVLLNVVSVTASTFRGIGAIVVLWLVSPTIQMFLVWQLSVYIIQAMVTAVMLWRELPSPSHRPAFHRSIIKDLWKFSAGISGISVLSVILTQMDKVILSKMLSLEMFGYYSLASLVAMSLGRVFTPIFFSIYPRFTQLVSSEKTEELILLYHKVCQFIAVLILPAAVILSLYSYEIMLLWTQNSVTAEQTYLIITIMVIGTAFNGLMNPPYALQLAFGWTSLPLYVNLLSVLILGPLTILGVMYYGAVGGAAAWLILNISYVIFWIAIMHKRILTKEKYRWYWQDVGIPFGVSLLIPGLIKYIFNDSLSRPYIFLELIGVALITVTAAAMSTPVTRHWIRIHIAKVRVQE